MAIVNPSNLYAGNAVRFDSTPYVNFAINQMAMKRAKQEALDNYFADQAAKINGQGLAPDEVKALLQEKNNFQKYYQQNRGLIHRNDPDALTNVNGYLNKMNEIVARGKDKVAINNQLNKARLAPGVSDLFNEDAVKQIQNSGAPIYKINDDGSLGENAYDAATNQQGYQPFNFDQDIFHPKPYTSDEMQKINSSRLKSISKNATPDVVFSPTGDKYNNLQTLTNTPTPEAIKQVGEDARAAINNDPRLAQTIRQSHPFATMSKEHEADFNDINDYYKSQTGKNILNDADLYVAEQMKAASQPSSESKVVANEAQKRQDRIDLENMKYGHSIGKLLKAAAIKKDSKKDEAINDVGALLGNIKDNMSGSQAETILPDWMKAANMNFENSVDVADPDILKEFATVRKVGTTPTPPNKISYDKKTKRFNLVYDPQSGVDDKGQPWNVPGQVIPISESDYLTKKAKSMYPTAKVSTILNIVNKLMNQNGGLYNTIKKLESNGESDSNADKSFIQSPKVIQHYEINDPKNWKQEGDNFRFADGSLYKLNESTGKMDKIK